MQVRGVAHGRHIAGSMPGRANAEGLAHRGQLAGRRETADGTDMAADEVNQPTFHQGLVLLGVHEQLTHGQRRRALPTDHGEPLDLLRRQNILQEKQPKGFQSLGQAHGLDGSQPLMDIVEQLHLVAKRVAQVGKQPYRVAGVAVRVVVGAGERTFGRGHRLHLASIAPHLRPHVPQALFHEAPHVVFHLGRLAAVGVAVDGNSLAALATQQLVHR